MNQTSQHSTTDQKNKDVFALSLRDFLQEPAATLRKKDELGSFEIAGKVMMTEKEIRGSDILLVQGIWGAGKSVFLKFLFWQKKHQIEQTTTETSKKIFIPIIFTPRHFDKNDFYSEFFGLLKNGLLQKKYNAELDASIDKLLKTLYHSDSLRANLAGLLMSGSKKSLDDEITDIAKIIGKKYAEYHIMIGIDEIDRLHGEDLMELGKLLDLIKGLHEKIGSDKNNVVYCRSNEYLQRLAVPGSYEDEKSKLSIEEYFSRFWVSRIDIYHETMDQLSELIIKILDDRFNDNKYTNRAVAHDRDIQDILSALAKKYIAVHIRSVKKLIKDLGKKMKMYIDRVKYYGEINLSDMFDDKNIKLLLYFWFVYLIEESDYREVESILGNRNRYTHALYSNDIGRPKIIVDIQLALLNLHPFLTGYFEAQNSNPLKGFLEERDVISGLIESKNEDRLLEVQKKIYFKQYVVNKLSKGDIEEAVENFLKYKADLKYNDLSNLVVDKISLSIGDSQEKQALKSFLLAILEKFVQLILRGGGYENIYHGRIGSELVNAITKIVSNDKEDQYDNTINDFLLPLIQKVKNNTDIDNIAKVLILLPFWWNTRGSYSEKEYREIVKAKLDNKKRPNNDICISLIGGKDISFALQKDSSSSLYMGYLIMEHLAQGFNESGKAYLDEYVIENMKSAYDVDETEALKYIRYLLQLFSSENGIFENLDGFISLFSDDTKIKLMIRMFGNNGFDKKIILLGDSKRDKEFNQLVVSTIKQQIKKVDFDKYKGRLEEIRLLGRETYLTGKEFDDIAQLIDKVPTGRKS